MTKKLLPKDPHLTVTFGSRDQTDRTQCSAVCTRTMITLEFISLDIVTTSVSIYISLSGGILDRPFIVIFCEGFIHTFFTVFCTIVVSYFIHHLNC